MWPKQLLGICRRALLGLYNLHRYDVERRIWLTKLSEHYEELSLAGSVDLDNNN